MRHPKCFTEAKIRLDKGARVHPDDMAKGDLPAVMQESKGLGVSRALDTQTLLLSCAGEQSPDLPSGQGAHLVPSSTH